MPSRFLILHFFPPHLLRPLYLSLRLLLPTTIPADLSNYQLFVILSSNPPSPQWLLDRDEGRKLSECPHTCTHVHTHPCTCSKHHALCAPLHSHIHIKLHMHKAHYQAYVTPPLALSNHCCSDCCKLD